MNFFTMPGEQAQQEWQRKIGNGGQGTVIDLEIIAPCHACGRQAAHNDPRLRQP